MDIKARRPGGNRGGLRRMPRHVKSGVHVILLVGLLLMG